LVACQLWSRWGKPNGNGGNFRRHHTTQAGRDLMKIAIFGL